MCCGYSYPDSRKNGAMRYRPAILTLLLLPLLTLGCSGGAATVPAPTATETPAPAVATTRVASAAVVPMTTVATVATATRAANATASGAASATAISATAQRTATRASVPATPGPPVATRATAPGPLGVAPPGWRTYRGQTQAPFALFYPPTWTVDESRVSEGRVYFYAPGVREPFEDAVWVLIATTGRAEPGGNIDVLRDQYFNSEIRVPYPAAGIDVTRNNSFSGLTFASLGATFDADTQLCYAYIGLGLNGGVPWRFRLNSPYSVYSQQLESDFAPMIGSLNIYANP